MEQPAAGGHAPGGEPSSPGVRERTFVETYRIPPLLFGYLCVVFFFLLYQGAGAVAGFLLYGLAPGPGETGGYRIFSGLAQIALLLVPTFFVVRLTTREPSRFLRLRWPGLPQVLVPVAGILSLQQMLQVYMVIQESIPVPDYVSERLQVLKDLIEQAYRLLLTADSPAELVSVVIVVAVIPAVSEEIFFRGLAQRSFENGLGPARGIIVTGIVFAAFHMNPFLLVPLIVLGIYLGFLTHRSGSVWVGVVAHFFNNLGAVLVLWSGRGEGGLITGDPREMSFLTLMLTFWFSGVIFLLSTYYFIRLTRAPVSAPDAEGGQA